MSDVLNITEQLQKMADLSTDVDVINTGLKAIDEIERLSAENEKLRAALINLWAAAYDLPQTKECRLYDALRDADEVLKEA